MEQRVIIRVDVEPFQAALERIMAAIDEFLVTPFLEAFAGIGGDDPALGPDAARWRPPP